jgi:hypothetical protein
MEEKERGEERFIVLCCVYVYMLGMVRGWDVKIGETRDVSKPLFGDWECGPFLLRLIFEQKEIHGVTLIATSLSSATLPPAPA